MSVVLTQAGRLPKTGLGGRAWAKGGWVDAPAWAGRGSPLRHSHQIHSLKKSASDPENRDPPWGLPPTSDMTLDM